MPGVLSQAPGRKKFHCGCLNVTRVMYQKRILQDCRPVPVRVPAHGLGTALLTAALKARQSCKDIGHARSVPRPSGHQSAATCSQSRLRHDGVGGRRRRRGGRSGSRAALGRERPQVPGSQSAGGHCGASAKHRGAGTRASEHHRAGALARAMSCPRNSSSQICPAGRAVIRQRCSRIPAAAKTLFGRDGVRR